MVQAGDTVYETGDFQTFNSVGTVNQNARLRGPREHIWNLTDVVIITDVAKIQPVMQWDGTTFGVMPHNLTGDLIAQHAAIDNERLYLANIISNAVDTPHLLVGSKRGNYDVLSTADRPSDALSEEDPFFIPVPDLKAINGLAAAFGVLAISTRLGAMWQLQGDSAKDFLLSNFYPGSNADGDEAVKSVGNDIVFGSQGRLESLVSTERFGDVETDDLSLSISPDVEDLTDWQIAYNRRFQTIYFHSGDQEALWAYYKSMPGTGLSPWSKFTTKHTSGLNPSAIMALFDPQDGLEYTFWGDGNGNIYRLEGAGASGDAGTNPVLSFRVSKLETAPRLTQAYNVSGTVAYRKGAGVTVNLRIAWQGRNVHDTTAAVVLPGAENRPLYSGGNYYSGKTYYGTFGAGRLYREVVAVTGRGEDFQLRTEVEDANSFEINEVKLVFSVSG